MTQIAETNQARIEALGIALSGKRRAAIEWRKRSGIEGDWVMAEAAYAGEESGRGGSRWDQRPAGYSQARTSEARTTAILNITAPFVDAAGARIADMLVPTHEPAFGLEATPIPELPPEQMIEIGQAILMQQQAAMQQQQAVLAQQQMAMNQQGMPGQQQEIPGQQQMPMNQQQGMPDQQEMPGQQQLPSGVMPMQISDMLMAADQYIAAIKEQAAKAAKRDEERIKDAVINFWNAEVRDVIMDAAKTGCGILKGPYPVKRRQTQRIQTPEGPGVLVAETFEPQSRRVSYWDCYPDPDGGDDIQAGSYFFEKFRLSKRKLMDIMGGPGVLDEQVKQCLDEGPLAYDDVEGKAAGNKNTQFTGWHYYGILDPEDLAAAECECERPLFTHITMVNHRVVRLNPDPYNGEDNFPYCFYRWKHRNEDPWGDGVAKALAVPQRMLTSAFRAMSDNAGLSAGPQWAYRAGIIEPMDGELRLSPMKGWRVLEEADIKDVSQAIQFFTVPSVRSEMMGIISFALQMAEQVTGLPALLQGMQGNAPDTVGGMTILQNNATSVLRRLAKEFDDAVIDPHIKAYYQWLSDQQGDARIVPKGVTALLERDIFSQDLQVFMQLSANPIYGLDPKKVAGEYLRARRIDPKKLMADDEGVDQTALPVIMQAAVKQEEFAQKDKDRQAKLTAEAAKLEQADRHFNQELAVKGQMGSGI